MTSDVIIKKFDTALAYLEWAANAPCLWKGELASRKVSTDDWAGTKTFEEAYNLARNGWVDGLKLLQKNMKLAESVIPPVTHRVNHYDVAGFRPHPGRAAAGDAFSMVNLSRNEIKTMPIVKMRVRGSVLSRVSPEKVMQYGAAVCSYIDMLERRGHSVELIYVSESRSSGPSTSFQFSLKEAGQPLSLVSLVFWWANPAAMRRITFSGMERLDIEQWYSSGYGSSSDITPVPSDTLYLNIEDAKSDIADTLRHIQQKHAKMLGQENPLAKKLETLRFG